MLFICFKFQVVLVTYNSPIFFHVHGMQNSSNPDLIFSVPVLEASGLKKKRGGGSRMLL